MNTKGPPSELGKGAMTFAIWRRAPLLWSIYIVGTWLDRAGIATADAGYSLAGWALVKLEARK